MEVTEAEALAVVEEPMTTKAVPVVATPVVQVVMKMETLVAEVRSPVETTPMFYQDPIQDLDTLQ